MKITQKIIIIGAGEIGQAIGKILRNKERNKEVVIEFWDKKPVKISGQKSSAKIISSIETLAADANFLFLCVPSWTMRQALTTLRQQLNKKTIVISLAKGIEEKTLKTMDQLLEEILPKKQNFALLAGPMLAEKLSAKKMGVGVVGSSKRETFIALTKLFKGTNLQLEYSSDIYGVALVSVLKNIYAIGLGIADALNFGENIKGWLTQKAIKEMAEIIEALDGQQETALGSAGLGDLITTGFSPYSSNRQLGRNLIHPTKGKSLIWRTEGLASLPPLLKLLSKNKKQIKINNLEFLKALQDIILKDKKTKTIFAKFVSIISNN